MKRRLQKFWLVEIIFFNLCKNYSHTYQRVFQRGGGICRQAMWMPRYLMLFFSLILCIVRLFAFWGQEEIVI